MKSGVLITTNSANRQHFIGGSDARVIMGDDEGALLRLWREKRGEIEPEDLSGNLIVQLGAVTEPLNRQWYERNTGEVLLALQRHVKHPVVRWMAATLDGIVEATGAVFEAKFMLPWSFSEEAAADKQWHSFSTTWGSPTPSSRSSPLSPAAASGSKLAYRQTRSISTSS